MILMYISLLLSQNRCNKTNDRKSPVRSNARFLPDSFVEAVSSSLQVLEKRNMAFSIAQFNSLKLSDRPYTELNRRQIYMSSVKHLHFACCNKSCISIFPSFNFQFWVENDILVRIHSVYVPSNDILWDPSTVKYSR